MAARYLLRRAFACLRSPMPQSRFGEVMIMSPRVFASAAALLAAFPLRAHAHPGNPLAPHDLWTAWSAEPGVLFTLGLAAWLYARGLRCLWRNSAPGRGIRQWEATAFTCGWFLLALTMISPLHALGEVLFSAHMAQHTVLIAAAAPLLVLGRPVIPSLLALPQGWRRTLGGWTRAGWFRLLWAELTRSLVAMLWHSGSGTCRHYIRSPCGVIGCTCCSTSASWARYCSSGGLCSMAAPAEQGMGWRSFSYSPLWCIAVPWGRS